MLVFIEDGKSIISFDSFPISYRGISIKNQDEIVFDNFYQLVDNSPFYSLYDKNHDSIVNVVFYPENRIHHFLAKNENRLLISNIEKDANIYDPLLGGDVFINGCCLVANGQRAYVNKVKYEGQPLCPGDEIEIMGTRIIWFKDFMEICSCQAISGLLAYKPKPLILLPKSRKEAIDYREYREFQAEKIREFHYEKVNHQPLSRQLLSGVLMSLTMISISVLAYFLNGSSFGIMYLIMPVSIIMSSIIIPISTYLLDKNLEKRKNLQARNDYLKYLLDYKEKLLADLSVYCCELAHPRKVFLCIGHYQRKINVDFPFCADETIMNAYRDIDRISYVNEYPFELDTDFRRIDIYARDCYQKDVFEMLLSELEKAFEYDFQIAIYGLPEADKIYGNLSCLYKNGRLILDDSELEKLDEMQLQKDIFVFAFKEVHIGFVNSKIHLFRLLPIESYQGQGLVLYGTYGFYDGQRFHINWQKHQPQSISDNLPIDSATSFKAIQKELSISDNYKKEEGLLSIFALKDGIPFGIDFHEKGQGPHGLIGGSTGSGKSELLISLLLGLCIRYSPSYLNIIIIDYKGGGIKESLSYNGEMLPHIIAHLSNLQDNAFERLIYAIKNECKRRQLLFQELSEKLRRAIVNLDEYQANYQKAGFEKMAHLLILVDEFAQLKKEHPEYIKELVAISRIGRSLGLHLLLATQKPAGVIDEEIFSNSSFKIALRTFQERDSVDLIGCKDAKLLTEKGEFILLADDKLTKARSVFAKRKARIGDGRIILLDDKLRPVPEEMSDEVEIESICNEIINICKNNNINSKPLSFLPLSSQKRKSRKSIGISDDYINEDYHEVKIDLNEHAILVDTRRDAANNLHNILNEEKNPYIFLSDKRMKGGYLSDSILYQEYDDIIFLFESFLNGNQSNVTLLINDLSAFLAYHDDYGNYLLKIMAIGHNIKVLALSSSANIKYRYLMAFEQRFLIGDDNVLTVFGKRSTCLGHSFYYDEEVKPFIPYQVEEYRLVEQKASQRLRKIPERIIAEKKGNAMLIGYDYQRRKALYGKGDIELFSYDQKLLDRYEKAYGLKGTLCHYGKNCKHGRVAVWLGNGFISQRVFQVFAGGDIGANEGYLFVENKVRKIRILDE